MQEITGRPIVNSHTSYSFKFVDHFLQLHILNLSSYVRDTRDFYSKS